MNLLKCIAVTEWTPLLYFALGFSLKLIGVIDQPFLMVKDRQWLFTQAWVSIGFGAIVSVVTTVIVGIDVAGQIERRVEPLDLAFYPRVSGIIESWRVLPARLLLVSGSIGLLAYFVGTQLQVMLAGYQGRSAMPSSRFLTTGLALWGILWLADCLGRPRCGAVVAPAIFLGLALLGLTFTYK